MILIITVELLVSVSTAYISGPPQASAYNIGGYSPAVSMPYRVNTRTVPAQPRLNANTPFQTSYGVPQLQSSLRYSTPASPQQYAQQYRPVAPQPQPYRPAAPQSQQYRPAAPQLQQYRPAASQPQQNRPAPRPPQYGAAPQQYGTAPRLSTPFQSVGPVPNFDSQPSAYGNYGSSQSPKLPLEGVGGYNYYGYNPVDDRSPYSGDLMTELHPDSTTTAKSLGKHPNYPGDTMVTQETTVVTSYKTITPYGRVIQTDSTVTTTDRPAPKITEEFGLVPKRQTTRNAIQEVIDEMASRPQPDLPTVNIDSDREYTSYVTVDRPASGSGSDSSTAPAPSSDDDEGSSEDGATPAPAPAGAPGAPAECKDDPNGDVANNGVTCEVLKDVQGCDIDLNTLSPALDKGTFVKLACPVTCNACP